MPTPPPKKKTIYRSSETGQIITKRQAEARPRESEKERVRVVKRGKGR